MFGKYNLGTLMILDEIALENSWERMSCCTKEITIILIKTKILINFYFVRVFKIIKCED